MAFKISKSGRIVKASLPRKLPKGIINEVEKGNKISEAFKNKAQITILNAKVSYEF
jgi:hypothetical protein